MEHSRDKTLFEKQKKSIKKDKKLFKITKVQRGSGFTKLPIYSDQYTNIQHVDKNPVDFDSPLRRGSHHF